MEGQTMPSTNRLTPAVDLIAAGGLAFVVGGAWYAILMRRIWAAAAYGPICGHAKGIGLHCPACYAALALIGLGLGLSVLAAGRDGARVAALGFRRSGATRHR